MKTTPAKKSQLTKSLREVVAKARLEIRVAPPGLNANAVQNKQWRNHRVWLFQPKRLDAWIERETQARVYRDTFLRFC